MITSIENIYRQAGVRDDDVPLKHIRYAKSRNLMAKAAEDAVQHLISCDTATVSHESVSRARQLLAQFNRESSVFVEADPLGFNKRIPPQHLHPPESGVQTPTRTRLREYLSIFAESCHARVFHQCLPSCCLSQSFC